VGVAYGGTGATTLTGVLKGNGTSAFTAAVAGTDYLAPSSVIDGGTF
jgi:delta-aminolevulinic acid dehydratase/porphobilinogen synthase